MPATTPVLVEIGAIDKVEAAGFPRKYGAAWTSAQSRDVAAQRLHRPDPRLPGRRGPVRRAGPARRRPRLHLPRRPGQVRPDPAQARAEPGREGLRGRAGAAAWTSTDPDQVTVTCRVGPGGGDVTARMVVDAVGPADPARQPAQGQGARPGVRPVRHPHLVRGLRPGGARADAEQGDYIFIHFLPITDTWVWQIPITDTVTSIGVVTQKKRFAEASADRERFFWDCVGSRPDLQTALQQGAAGPAVQGRGRLQLRDDGRSAATGSC